MQRTRLIALAALLLSGFLHAAQPAAASEPAPPQPLSTLPIIGGGEIVLAQIIEYSQAVEQARAVEAAVAIAQAAEVARLEAEAALERERARVYVAPQRSAPSVVSGACGGATNGADQFIQRESGGDPNVYNSGGSGAWGCYQLMPMHFGPGGACSDMTYGAASPAQQAECASRLPLSAWAL